MDKDLVKFYLQKIENMAKEYFLNSSEFMRNELLNYIEICIEICNLMKRRFNKEIDKTLQMFKDIQANVLLRDMATTLTFIQNKKKELETAQTLSSSI